jgi:hypothetical protein
LPRDRDDELPIPDQIAHGERVAGEVVFVPTPEPLGRSYDWKEELDRQRSLSFNRFYSSPPRPRPAGFHSRSSLRRS